MIISDIPLKLSIIKAFLTQDCCVDQDVAVQHLGDNKDVFENFLLTFHSFGDHCNKMKLNLGASYVLISPNGTYFTAVLNFATI